MIGQVEQQNLLNAYKTSEIVRTSLGPLGRDKLIVKENGEVLVTNDGKTLLEEMKLKNPIARLLVNLSKNQDLAVGDGTTSVVVFCGQLCLKALQLQEKGIHPLDIIEGYKIALEYSISELKNMSIKEIESETEYKKQLSRAAKTSLNSKMIGRDKNRLSEICVDAVYMISDLERKDINLDLVKMDYIPSGSFEDIKLYKGISLWKSFSHEGMKEMKNCKILMISFPLEIPKLKTKYNVNVKNIDDYQNLLNFQQEFYEKIFKKLKGLECNLLICQWGIDHEINDFLFQNNISAIRWVAGDDLERIAMATSSKICPRFEDLSKEYLGFCGEISQELLQDGTSLLTIKDCKNPKACSILVKGSNKLQCEDTIRSLYDALCNVRNAILDGSIIIGGGATEIELYLKLIEYDKKNRDYFEVIKAWAESLLSIPSTLAENAAMNALEATLGLMKEHEKGNKHYGILFQKKKGKAILGDMLKEGVFENIRVKESLLKLATEMCTLILKIDEIISFEE